MIRHSVAFTLRHDPGSAAEADFLASADVLATIPGVERFQKLRETSPKNSHSFVFAMEFNDQASYDAYDQHPDHQGFVSGRWIPEVAEFIEIDTEPLV